MRLGAVRPAPTVRDGVHRHALQPDLLTAARDYVTASITNLRFTNAEDDIAIQYYAGSKDGNSALQLRQRPTRSGLPHDWICSTHRG